jgi:predicted transcriptional regulator
MELDELLLQFGFTRSFTKVLLYCAKHKDEDIRMHDIEREMDLRQPEVSTAINDLIERKWVKATKLTGQGKPGHPGKSYHLAVSPKRITECVVTEIYERIDKDKRLAEDIRVAMAG